MDDLGLLSEDAVAAAAKYLGEKAVGGALSVGAQTLAWIKGKLTNPVERIAIEKLQENPDSKGIVRTLEGFLLTRLEQDGALVQSLTEILKERPTALNQTTVGDENDVVQIAGNSNSVSIGSRKDGRRS